MSTRRDGHKFCAFLIVLLLPTLVWCQANVNENLETASIYVNGATGSDSNPGTQSQPLQTIGAAATMASNNNYQNIGSKVIIDPGTYRESVTIGKNFRTTSLPITFEAATAGTVTVSGADVWSNWVAYSGNPSIYTQAWPYQWGECAAGNGAPTEQDIVLRQEMIFVNGTALTEVLALASMQPGTFFPDEANATVYVWPPAGTEMSTATVEVATRPVLFTDIGQSYIVLRGLTFQYANSCRMNAAVFFENNATNVLVDTDTFQWNNASGLSFTTPQNFTVQSSIANHNGQAGMTSYEVKYGSWQSDTADYNNWRGAQGAFYTWDAAGFHFMLDHNGTFQNLTAVYNQTFPVHFDTDNANVSLNSAVAVGNVNGFLLEKSEGPMTISNVNLCTNALASYANNAGGFILRASTALTFTGNSLYGNGANQITPSGVLGGISVTNWETGEVYQLVTRDVTFKGNQVAGSSAEQLFSDGLGGSDWTTFTSTLSSANNVYWANTNTNAFTVPDPRPGTVLDLSGWKSLTGQDQNSSWSSVAYPAACEVSSGFPDFMLLTGNINPLTVSASGAATDSVTTVGLGGLSGTINLSVAGLSSIAGAKASFLPATISGSGTSLLTITTSANTPAGTYPIMIVGNSGNITHTMTLSMVVPKTSVRLSTTSLAFPGQGISTTSSAQIIGLTNVGSSSLDVTSLQVNGSFGQTNNCGTSVKPGGTCNISVTFSPHLTGPLSGNLTIEDSDETSPQVTSLSGTGLPSPDVAVSPTYVGFGVQKINSKATQEVGLDNKGGAALTITKMTITGANAADFSQTSNCGSSLATGATCTVQVTFVPSTTDQESATLSIYDNSSKGTVQTVSLHGKGGKE
jgi:hypothetical protein